MHVHLCQRMYTEYFDAFNAKDKISVEVNAKVTRRTTGVPKV